jgi:peptide-methionine (S)-S-oxide reductase
VCGKKTGAIEVVKISYDPSIITYRDLLDVFFTVHDPTTPDRQGARMLWLLLAAACAAVVCERACACLFCTTTSTTTPFSPFLPPPKPKQPTGNDVGPQYASAIFYADDAQLSDAKAAIEEVTKAGLWPAPIVTKLLPLASDGPAQFWPAEEYHWDYFSRNPSQPYCAAVVAPKVAKFRAKWAAKLM